MNYQTTIDSVLSQTKRHLPWLGDRIIFAGIHGSHAYGLANSLSDEDVRGICIPPKEYLYGIKEFKHADLKDPDTFIFSLTKFINLAAGCNPNCVELLFLDKAEQVIVTELGEKLIENRNLFLSKLAKNSFLGYAKSQLHRIENHRVWVRYDSSNYKKPRRSDFGLSEIPEISKEEYDIAFSFIQKKLDKWTFDFNDFTDFQKDYLKNEIADCLIEMKISSNENWQAAARLSGMSESFIKSLSSEKKYRSAVKDWENYNDWLVKRNPKRFEMEKKCGYDSKHASHLLRLLFQVNFLLKEGVLLLKDPTNKDFLLQVKNGDVSYEEMIGKAKELEAIVIENYKTTSLQDFPDSQKIEQLTLELIEDAQRILK